MKGNENNDRTLALWFFVILITLSLTVPFLIGCIGKETPKPVQQNQEHLTYVWVEELGLEGEWTPIDATKLKPRSGEIVARKGWEIYRIKDNGVWEAVDILPGTTKPIGKPRVKGLK